MVLEGKIVKKDSALAKHLRRKISKKKKEALGSAALSFGDLIYDLSRIDPRYVLGASFSRPSANISSKLKIGAQNLKDLKDPRDGKALFGKDYLDHLHTHNYAGGTHEYVTDTFMRSKGIEVVIPDKMNQPGWDRIYNGQPYQIKFNTVEGIRKARLENPNITVLADIETAEEYKTKFPEDAINVIGTTPKAVTENILQTGREASLEVHKDEEFFETGVPEFFGIASVVSSVKNFVYLSKKQTDIKTAVQNVAIDSFGRGAGIWAGAKIGGVILGPVGAMLGAGAGALFSGGIIDEFKVGYFCEKEIKDVEKKLSKLEEEADKIFKINQHTIKDKVELLDMTLGSENYRKKYLKENKITKELYDFLVEKFVNEKKGLERLHYRKKVWLKKFGFYTSAEKLKIIDDFLENNNEIGIPYPFLKNETEELLASSKKLIDAMKKRGI